MKIIYSFHWTKQKVYRPEITDDLIEICIQNSKKIRDRKWKNAFNAIAKIPITGRTLKVIYRDVGKDIKRIISAYWLD